MPIHFYDLSWSVVESFDALLRVDLDFIEIGFESKLSNKNLA